MAPRVKVRASNPGHPGRWRAGRLFLNDREYVLEVVSDPSDGPALGANEPVDPKTGRPDMARISRAGLAAVEADRSGLVVVRFDGASEEGSADLVKAKSEINRLRTVIQQEVEDIRAEAKATIDGLTAELVEVRAKLADAEAKLAEAAKAPEYPPAKVEETKVEDTKAEGKKGKGGK